MVRSLQPDLCVIGAGSAGLSVAAGASQMGASTVLIEKGAMGGDCLNTGCVPSKALLAAAHHAEAWRASAPFGIETAEPPVDFAAVNAHVHGVIGAIAPHDSVERFEGLGVTVLSGHARFADARTVHVALNDGSEARVTPRRFVIATGSRAAIPPVPGIGDVPLFTNETIFENRTRPDHLVVLGGGPIGLEMAQAHRRLGSRVTVVERFRILPRDDADLVAVLRERLAAEGVAIVEDASVSRIEPGGADDAGVRLVLVGDGGKRVIEGSHLLIAAGRSPNVDVLDLERAGIAYDRGGIQVDGGLRTTNRRAYAIGDVAGGPQFTHVAGYHASVVVKNALFRLPAKVDYRALPWVTYTDPELAQVGLTEAAARERFGDGVRTVGWSFAENDRAQAERRTEGRIKAMLDRKGRVLGASIVSPSAGELVLPWGLAIHKRLKIGDLATLIAPYPTFSEVTKRAAGSYFTDRLFSDGTRRIVRLLARLG